MLYVYFFFSSRRRHTRCALVTGVQTCALPILPPFQPLEVPMAAAVNDAAKRGWRPNPKIWLLLGAFVGGSVALTGLAEWSADHLYLVNTTESLPNSAFHIAPGPRHANDAISFSAPTATRTCPPPYGARTRAM